MIIGANKLEELGIILNFEQKCIKQDKTRILMKSKLDVHNLKDSNKYYHLFITLSNTEEPTIITDEC